ncbi:hypothetical protein ACFPZ0_00370 [Streptomonospora nanhaiensis]|uniref:Polyketide cyclase n=1 Tax=Streptomonospora nanhaiensis TaxID=1323731 RepID=A0A853BJF7_9ACTN|nr:hypothetical protein [Streptomonospora nanhaiensis]MBV2364206.1 hypothetical protein [Streptomonospora nanhaiensis]MBX9386674.1 hypothetical protein [Streptomonospora nanhaiensis]NYI95160.1 hypothetical protein [Streptomonospora nanhaiensis]
MALSPPRRRLLAEASATVPAPRDSVADLLLSVRSGPAGPDNGWLLIARGGPENLTLTGGPNTFTAHAPDHRFTVEVDRAHRTIALQGGWWYRGEFAVQPCPSGARIVHRVYDVARRGRWLVPLANRGFVGFRAATQRGLADIAERAAAELSGRARGRAAGGA